MAIIQDWMPPSREHWELVTHLWQFFPLITIAQWLTDWYPQGKTSTISRWNIPGKIGWATMEAPGFMLLLYIMFTLPQENDISELPLANWTMAAMFTIHYVYRALLAPLYLNPSMSPINPLVWLLAFAFQITNATCIGGWLAGYGPTTVHDWSGRYLSMELGMMIFGVAFLSNVFHDDDLREIRRAAARSQKRRQEAGSDGAKKSVDKVYRIPESGLFALVLYPHYLSEWVEWAGFWMVGGLHCVPARTFLVNEIATMLPRALSGKRWYIERFGREKMGNKKAVIPGLL